MGSRTMAIKPAGIQRSNTSFGRSIADPVRTATRINEGSGTFGVAPKILVAATRSGRDFAQIPVFTDPDHLGIQFSPRVGALQAKLNIGDVNDPLESEADRVAEQIMRMSDPGGSFGTSLPQISRKSDASEQGEKPPEREAATQAVSEAPSSVHEVLRAPGQPLDHATRAFFEPRFGCDFSSVRVHADEKAAHSARSIDAHAYAAGNDIVFNKGKFAPAAEGQRLLAHELTHVIQQAGPARTVRRAPIVAPNANKATAKKGGGSKATSSSFNSYADLFNGFQDLAAAAINRAGAGLDSARFGNDLSASHRSLLWRVRKVLIQAQDKDKQQRLAAAAAWPELATKLLGAVAEGTRLQLPGEVLAAVTDDIALLGRKYVHARTGKAEPEEESFEDYADTVQGMNDLLWIFGQLNEGGQGLIREEVPNRKETTVSSAVVETNAKQRAALEKVQFGIRLNVRHAKVMNTLRTALLMARSEAPGSAYKALTLWHSIRGDLQHVLNRAPHYQVQFDVSGVQKEVDSTSQALENHYAAVHQENVGVALTKPRSPEQVKAERTLVGAWGPAVAAGLHEARAVEDFRYGLAIIEQHLVPSPNRPGEWILTSGDTVIRVRADQVQSLRATVARELTTYMAQIVKAMVRLWETYDSIQRGNSTFKRSVLGRLGGATDPGDQTRFKESLISVRDNTVYPLVKEGKYVEAFQWIMTEKAVVDRQAKEVGDYDSDLDLGYSRLATAAHIVQVALVSLVPIAGEAALAGEASVWAVGGTAIVAGGVGAGAAETARQVASGEDLDLKKIGKTTYSGALIGASALGPAATRGLSKFILPVQEGTAAVGANAFAAGTVGSIQSKLGGDSAITGFAGGFAGSIAGSATSEALGSIAKNPVVKTVVGGGIGAGTGVLTGDPLGGAVGGITGALVPHTGGARTPGGTDVAEARVGGEITEATGAGTKVTNSKPLPTPDGEGLGKPPAASENLRVSTGPLLTQDEIDTMMANALDPGTTQGPLDVIGRHPVLANAKPPANDLTAPPSRQPARMAVNASGGGAAIDVTPARVIDHTPGASGSDQAEIGAGATNAVMSSRSGGGVGNTGLEGDAVSNAGAGPTTHSGDDSTSSGRVRNTENGNKEVSPGKRGAEDISETTALTERARNRAARDDAAQDISDRIQEVREQRAQEIAEKQDILPDARAKGEKVQKALLRLNEAKEAALRDKSKLDEFRQARSEYEAEQAKLRKINERLQGYDDKVEELHNREKNLEDALAEGRRREAYMGPTPGKDSPTGREVQARMRKGPNPTLRPNPDSGELEFLASNKNWYPLSMADMTHKIDAVTWWNEEGRSYGARAPEVLRWMKNSENYRLDLLGLNRQAGAKLGQEYLPPLRR